MTNYIIAYKTSASNQEHAHTVTANSPREGLEVLADELSEAFKSRTGTVSIYRSEQEYQNKKPSKTYDRKQILNMFAPKQKQALGQQAYDLMKRIKTGKVKMGPGIQKLFGKNADASSEVTHKIVLGKWTQKYFLQDLQQSSK